MVWISQQALGEDLFDHSDRWSDVENFRDASLSHRLLFTANQPFGSWDEIFPDMAMTAAAIDRLVHHAVILEMNADSYRRKAAVT